MRQNLIAEYSQADRLLPITSNGEVLVSSADRVTISASAKRDRTITVREASTGATFVLENGTESPLLDGSAGVYVTKDTSEAEVRLTLKEYTLTGYTEEAGGRNLSTKLPRVNGAGQLERWDALAGAYAAVGLRQTRSINCVMDFFSAKSRLFTFSGGVNTGWRTDIGDSGVTPYGHQVARLTAVRAGTDAVGYLDISEAYINTWSPAPLQPGHKIVVLLRVNASYANSKIGVRFTANKTPPFTSAFVEGKAWLNSIRPTGETPAAVFALVIPMSDINAQSSTSDFGATPGGMRLYVESLTTDGTTDVDVLGVYQTKERPVVIWDFDDGGTSALTAAKPIFDTYGLIGNISMAGTVAGGSYNGIPIMTAAQCQELYAAGWGFTTHGENGHGADLAANSVSIAANKAFLVDNGLTGDEGHYVYPGGDINYSTGDSFAALAANGMETGRVTTGPQCSSSFFGWGTDATLQFNPYRLPSFSVQETADPTLKLQLLEHEIANLARHGGVLILQSHNCIESTDPNFSNSRDITPATLTAAARIVGMYQDRGLIEVVRRSDWWPYVATTRAQRLQLVQVN